MLTKKYYEMIAAAIRADAAHFAPNIGPYTQLTEWGRGAYDQWHTLVLNLADAFAADNPRFDRARFLKACGVAS